MNPIPTKLRKELSPLLIMNRCVICGSIIVSWHHVYTYARKQIHAKNMILPMCGDHHNKKEPERICLWVSLNLINMDYIELKYPNIDVRQKRNYLNNIYGEFDESMICNLTGLLEKG